MIIDIIINIPHFLFPTPYWLFPIAYASGAVAVKAEFGKGGKGKGKGKGKWVKTEDLSDEEKLGRSA